MYAEMIYHCDFCGYTGSKAEVLRHEAFHFGLSPQQYEEWRALDAKVKKASWLVEGMSNEDTRAVLDKAIEALLAFEEEHKLKGKHLSYQG